MQSGTDTPTNNPMKRLDIPYTTFKNQEEAKEFAKNHGGFSEGPIHIEDKAFWLIFLPERRNEKDVKDVEWENKPAGEEPSEDENVPRVISDIKKQMGIAQKKEKYD